MNKEYLAAVVQLHDEDAAPVAVNVRVAIVEIRNLKDALSRGVANTFQIFNALTVIENILEGRE